MNQQVKLNKHQTYLVALGLFSQMKDASFAKDASVSLIEEFINSLLSNEIDAQSEQQPQEQLNISDWRDLRVGDIIKVYGDKFPVYAIEDQEDYEGRMAFAIKTEVGTVVWVNISEDKWKFISRPVSK